MIIDNAYKSTDQITIALKAKSKTNILIDLQKDDGWYDLNVTIKGDTFFSQQYAGHAENGSNSIFYLENPNLAVKIIPDMFFFNRSKKSQHKDFTAIGADMHSHLIPGVDDGAKDVADSIQLITGLQQLGFNKLYTTPHTLQDIHPNTRDSLQKGYNLLNGNIPTGVELMLSSEYYLDDQFQEQLGAGAVMPLPGNRLLIEFSQISRPHDLEEVIFDLGIRGYHVVLAHPERYLFFHKNFTYYTRLKDLGVELQVNALSLTDHYGKNIRSIADKLIEKDLIDFIGTDIHHVRHLETLKLVPATKSFARLVDSGNLKNQEL